jgi:hypothetical protein
VPSLVTVQVGADGDVEVLADIFGYYEAGSKLAVSALSWSSSTVDASAGSVANMLTFTVTDSDPAATQTSGELEIRQRAARAGARPGRHGLRVQRSRGRPAQRAELTHVPTPFDYGLMSEVFGHQAITMP